jgi:hypothetical protein
MLLKLKRYERRSGIMGKVIFGLEARLAVSAEDLRLIKKYGLGKWVVYDSTARKKHDKAAKGHLESTKEHPSVFDDGEKQFIGLFKIFYRFGRAWTSATRAALSLRITYDKLIQGTTVECEDMLELLDAEKAIRKAAENLKAYLNEAGTFVGKDELIELW